MNSQTRNYDMGYRERCFEAHGKECDICGDSGPRSSVVAHHISGDRRDNRIENLVPLCDDCHTKVHTDNGDERHREYFNNLRPGSQIASDGDGQKTTISVDRRIGDELREFKPDDETWDSFTLSIVEELHIRPEDPSDIAAVITDELGDEAREAVEEHNQKITEELQGLDEERIADIVSQKVIDYMKTAAR